MRALAQQCSASQQQCSTSPQALQQHFVQRVAIAKECSAAHWKTGNVPRGGGASGGPHWTWSSFNLQTLVFLLSINCNEYTWPVPGEYKHLWSDLWETLPACPCSTLSKVEKDSSFCTSLAMGWRGCLLAWALTLELTGASHASCIVALHASGTAAGLMDALFKMLKVLSCEALGILQHLIRAPQYCKALGTASKICLMSSNWKPLN